MNHRLAAGLILMLCLNPYVGAQQQNPPTITLGTFNIQELGKTVDPARITRLADICRGIDLLAVQEVAENGTGVPDLAAVMGSEYLHAVSEITTHERLGLIWKPPVTLLQPCEFLPDLVLGRKPFTGVFRAGNFDFRVVVVHLFWEGSKKTYPHTRGVELTLLDDWLCRRVDPELDLILMGDFNEPNMFYNMTFPPSYGFHDLFYRLLTRHNLISVSMEKRIPTSIVNQNIYDHILFNPSHWFCEEYMGLEGVEIVRWERAFDLNQNDTLEWPEYEIAKTMVSDHRLVKAAFRIDLEDDDENPQ
ncbi:endonuclease/exonuclease/phosphatase family protein [bacterium]|nr:endonuclease/exonuclease/phosphatase family protein [candidate division CSSED10-310 bacterium]